MWTPLDWRDTATAGERPLELLASKAAIEQLTREDAEAL
jgi:hypothetical protein